MSTLTAQTEQVNFVMSRLRLARARAKVILAQDVALKVKGWLLSPCAEHCKELRSRENLDDSAA